MKFNNYKELMEFFEKYTVSYEDGSRLWCDETYYEDELKEKRDYPDDALTREWYVVKDIVDKAYQTGKNDYPDYVLAYNDGYEAASKDPKAWYVLDMNGDRIHIGDEFTRGLITETVDELGIINGSNPSVNGHYASFCVKVKPDTREKIVDELGKIILALIESDVDIELLDYDGIYSANDLAEQFVKRVEALKEK